MPHVPLRPTMTLADAFAAAVRAAGDARLVGDDGEATLREIARAADGLAARLHEDGLRPGDHVALRLPNGVRYVEAFFAVVRLGGVVVPLDRDLPPRELEAVARAVPLRATLAEDDRRAPRDPRVLPPATARRREDPAAVFLTSGTTGDPKPVALSHHELVRPVVALQRLHASFFGGSPLRTAQRLATVARRHGRKLVRAAGRQTWMTVSPFRSMAGHEVMTGALLLGHDLVTARSFHPRRVLELVSEHRVNVLAGTPAMLELLLRVDDLSPYDLSSLLVIGVGGGPAAPDLVGRAGERFGCAVTIGYGSTELGGGVLATRLEDSPAVQAETVGRPFPGTDVRIVDEAGRDVGDGSPGELVVRPADAPAAAPWVRTGDLAVRDPDGNVRILGRRDDLVVRGGQNVHPLEVERAIGELAAVERCAVVGVPVGRDQQLWAYVVPRDGHAVDADAVRGHCRRALASWKQPDAVRVVGELPVNEQGEVRRHRLRDRARNEVAARAGARAR